MKQLIKNDDEGVSPVIGVVLMVAVTVILAAIIGSSILGLGQSSERGPSAGVTFSETGDGNVEAVVSSAQRLDSMTITVDATGGNVSALPIDSAEAGNTFYYCEGDAGDTIIVTSNYNGVDTVTQRYTLREGTESSGAGGLQGNPCGSGGGGT